MLHLEADIYDYDGKYLSSDIDDMQYRYFEEAHAAMIDIAKSYGKIRVHTPDGRKVVVQDMDNYYVITIVDD